MPKETEVKVCPSLESIVMRGKYKVFSGFREFAQEIESNLHETPWKIKRQFGESFYLQHDLGIFIPEGKKFKAPIYERVYALKAMRKGYPFRLFMTVVDHLPEGVVVEV